MLLVFSEFILGKPAWSLGTMWHDITLWTADIAPLKLVLMAAAVLGENHLDVSVVLGPVGASDVLTSTMDF